MNHIHVRIHRWVVWWFYVGLVGGVVALVNIVGRHLTRTEEQTFIVLGVLHWFLGGFVCWALEGIQVQPPQLPEQHPPTRAASEMEWHPASDFLLPGGGKRLLPPKY